MGEKELKGCKVLVASDSIEYYEELREQLYKVAEKEQCIEVFPVPDIIKEYYKIKPIINKTSISLLAKPRNICYNKWGVPMIPKRRWLMIQICRKDKEKVYEAICTGKIDAAEMSFPNLIDDILLTMKRRGLTAPLAQALTDKRRDNSHIPFDILLCLAVAAKLKRKTSLTDVPFAVTEAELLAELGWNLWDNERDVNEGLFRKA